GVAFTEQQKDQIKTMAEAGDKAGAIAKILEVVESRVGGAGEAEAQGLTGALARNAKAWGGLSIEVAKALGLLDLLQKKSEGATGALGAITGVLKDLQEPQVQSNMLGRQIATVQQQIASADVPLD